MTQSPYDQLLGWVPVAWSYEIATHRVQHGGAWSGWQHRLADKPPNVPPGAVRNLTPLYARPSGPDAQAALAARDDLLLQARAVLREFQYLDEPVPHDLPESEWDVCERAAALAAEIDVALGIPPNTEDQT